MKKRLLSLMTLVLALALAVGCASQPAALPSGDPQPTAEPQADPEEPGEEEQVVAADGETVVTVISVNDAAKLFHKEIIPIFEEEHPGIKVNFIETPFDQFDTKIQTMLASNTPLDLTTHNGWTGFGGRMANGQLLELDPYMEKYDFDPADYNIPEAASEVWKQNGKTYAIPVHIFPSFMLYNKDMFDEANLPYPPSDWEDETWTWDVMMDYARQMTKDPDDPVNAQYGLNWNWDAGGREQTAQYFGHMPFDDATFTTGFATACYFDTPEAIEAYQKIIDLTYTDKVSASPAVNEALGGNVFFAGLCAMYVDGGWVMAGTNDLPFEVGIAAIPRGGNDQVRATMWIDPYWIFSTSTCPDESFQYLAFLLRDDIQKRIVEASDGLAPANRNAFGTYVSFYSSVDAAEMEQAFQGGIKYGFEGMSHLMADSASLNTLIVNETDPMFKEGKPAADVLPDVQKRMEQFIEETNQKYGR